MPDVSELLQRGLTLHHAGLLAAAADCYRQAVALDDRQPDAWHLLGLVSLAEGRFPEARQQLQQAIALDGQNPLYHHHLAEALRCAGDDASAAASARRAIALQPNMAVAHHTLGRSLWMLGQLQDAADAFHNALQFDPQFAPAWSDLGGVQHGLEHLPEAGAALQRAIDLQPADAGARQRLAAVLESLGELPAAIDHLRAALALDPALLEAHFRLGVLLQGQGELPAAAEHYRRAIHARPDPAACNNLGTVIRLQGNLAEAAHWYRQALALDPASAEAHNNLGNVLKYLDHPDEALACYERAATLNPADPQTHYNRAMMYLAAGNFAAGWPEYAWRLRCPGFPVHQFSRPIWSGEPLHGQTLLVHAEQGLGDTLQFARYVKLLTAKAQTQDGRSPRILFQVSPKLVSLLSCSGFDNLVVEGEPLPEFDYHLPLLHLPWIFNTSLDNIPAAIPYLAADEGLVRQWRETLAAFTGLRVGIVWQGRERADAFLQRSIPLAQFAPLARAGVHLISLQKGSGSEQVRQVAGQFAVHELGEHFDAAHGPFMDTAAVMKSLDLVVTADTSIAHLTGGLDVRVWVALARVSEWRWLRNRTDSPWYPTMRLFRQGPNKEWEEVFAAMAAELANVPPAHTT